ncbi:response regulator transcription factor [Sinorhizobium sojae]|nr:response regulator transcription factor [Sinorhizobium sojae]
MSKRDCNGIGNGRAAHNGRQEPRRVVLIISDSGIVSGRLIYALEREFPSVVIEQVEDVTAACSVFPCPVSLILVDPGLVSEAEDRSAELLSFHPQALTAIVAPRIDRPTLFHVCQSPLVRSVLPMNLSLDIWLSVIRLMLCGGEYLPPELIRNAKLDIQSPALPPGNSFGPPRAKTQNTGIAELTARELQILEMVSRGLQNKLIAAEFRLSEHTVKIHLHNIITKLGAHNRTEAAARFRSSQERH